MTDFEEDELFGGERMSRLAMTSEDYERIHGTLDYSILAEHPGKTLAELMSDKELADYLKGKQKGIEKIRKDMEKGRYRSIEAGQAGIDALQTEYDLSVQYLQRIGRMPDLDK